MEDNKIRVSQLSWGESRSKADRAEYLGSGTHESPLTKKSSRDLLPQKKIKTISNLSIISQPQTVRVYTGNADNKIPTKRNPSRSRQNHDLEVEENEFDAPI